MYICSGCKKEFPSHFILSLHLKNCDLEKSIITAPPKKHVWDVGNVGHRDILIFLRKNKPNIRNLLANALNKHESIKYKIILHVTLLDDNKKSEEFHSKFFALEDSSEITDTINIITELFAHSTDVHKMQKIEINKIVVHHEPCLLNIGNKPTKLAPTCSEKYFTSQWGILEAIAVVHGYDSDNYSFRWAVLSALDWSKDGHKQVTGQGLHEIRDIAKRHINYCGVNFDFTDLQEFPHTAVDFQLFEQHNQNVSINIFDSITTEEGGSRFTEPLYRTQYEQELHINLLYYKNLDENKYHYAYITKFGSMIGIQRTYLCNTCLRYFWLKRHFSKHKSDKKNCAERHMVS